MKIETMWKDFCRVGLPHGLSTDSAQYKESRKVFYTGVALTLFEVREILCSNCVTDKEATESLQDMLNDVQKFYDHELAKSVTEDTD